MLEGRILHEPRELLGRLSQDHDRVAGRLPAQERRRAVEPDEVHVTPTGALQTGLQIQLGGQWQVRVPRDNADVEVAVPAQSAPSGRAEQDRETERWPCLEGTTQVVDGCSSHEPSIEQVRGTKRDRTTRAAPAWGATRNHENRTGKIRFSW